VMLSVFQNNFMFITKKSHPGTFQSPFNDLFLLYKKSLFHYISA